jgi:hypothetical protein
MDGIKMLLLAKAILTMLKFQFFNKLLMMLNMALMLQDKILLTLDLLLPVFKLKFHKIKLISTKPTKLLLLFKTLLIKPIKI